MPIYEYRCCDCAQIFEEWQKEHEPLDISCPMCGGKSEHIISNTAFVLKGTGWYVTDYARGGAHGSAGQADANKNDAATADAGSGSGSEAKSEVKTQVAEVACS